MEYVSLTTEQRGEILREKLAQVEIAHAGVQVDRAVATALASGDDWRIDPEAMEAATKRLSETDQVTAALEAAHTAILDEMKAL